MRETQRGEDRQVGERDTQRGGQAGNNHTNTDGGLTSGHSRNPAGR